MFTRLLTKHYIFGFIILSGAMLLISIQNAGVGSPMLTMSLRYLLGALLILIFFDLLRLGLVDERNSYRTMLMERPLFNPRGKQDALTMSYPLHPQFIAVYFDHEDENPYESRVYSIQAIRYEYGYYTDSLFLPIQSGNDPARGRLLSPEDATKLLTTYSRDFPLVVHGRDYGAVWLREQANSVLLTESIDTEDIARVIYPKLTEYGIEDVNDWLRFEVDEADPVYGAKITAAVYLDYLRLHDFNTTLSLNPLRKETELEPVFPEEIRTQEAIAAEYEYPAVTAAPGSFVEVPESAQEEISEKNIYIGPFTPIDEEGNPIPERGHLVARDGE